MGAAGGGLVACVDFGSTFTKAALVDLDSGSLVARSSHRTTVDSDVLDGWDACLAELCRVEPRASTAPVRACSSAGGGLRIGVVGNEELVTAEAGRRVALSSGGRVVHVASGPATEQRLDEIRAGSPDVLLLVGGTDGGNQEAVLAWARLLADEHWPGPVVVAGNVDARAEIAALLDRAGTPHVVTDNVVPQIGVLCPQPARGAIREMFLRHVIGGKHLSRRGPSLRRSPGQAFTEMVRGATPDVVLTAVELLARGLDEEHPGVGDVVVVDVGGATTDVHSVVELLPEDAELGREVVASVPVNRTVEADLGMRWSAVSTVEAGQEHKLPVSEGLPTAASVRRERPDYLPDTGHALAEEREIATLAVSVALRRHAGRSTVSFAPDATAGPDRGRVVERSGKDLREVALLVGSGGVLRHSEEKAALAVLRQATDPGSGGWQLPESPRCVVDRDYVLAPAGLLAADHPRAAYRLLRTLL